MFGECLALIATVCLNQNSHAEIFSTTLSAGARIDIESAKIMSLVRTDASPFPDRRRMHRYCAGRECIHYHVFCESLTGKHMCRVSYFEQGDGFRRRLEIVTNSEIQMSDIFSTLRIAALPSQKLIPLSAFRVKSPTPFPPYCRPREDKNCR